MKVLITWERLAPDTVGGDKLRVTTTYMSFDKDEIDKLEENLGETTAIIMDNVEGDKNDKRTGRDKGFGK